MTGGADPAAPAKPRAHPLLVVSLVLSAVSFALPPALGPLAAGVLAVLGYRKVRAAPAEFRGPGLARIAMTLALVVLAVQAWVVVRYAATAAAWGAVNREVERVDANLRTGTAEGAWDLFGPVEQGRSERAAFVAYLRGSMGKLGPLERLGEPQEAGGDWFRTDSFEEGDAAELSLRMAFDAVFRDGRGRVEIEVLVRRRGRVVSSEISALTVDPAGP